MHTIPFGMVPSMTRDRWIDEGLLVLAEEGAPGVRIDRIAARLGLSKGSFFHHFDGIAAYRRALLDRWESSAVRDSATKHRRRCWRTSLHMSAVWSICASRSPSGHGRSMTRRPPRHRSASTSRGWPRSRRSGRGWSMIPIVRTPQRSSPTCWSSVRAWRCRPPARRPGIGVRDAGRGHSVGAVGVDAALRRLETARISGREGAMKIGPEPRPRADHLRTAVSVSSSLSGPFRLRFPFARPNILSRRGASIVHPEVTSTCS